MRPIIRWWRPAWVSLAALLGATSLAALAEVALAATLQRLVNALLDHAPDRFVFVLWTAVGLSAVAVVLHFLRGQAESVTRQSVERSIRLTTVRALFRTSPETAQFLGSGDVVNRLVQDAGIVAEICSGDLGRLTSMAVGSVAAIAYVLHTDAILALIAAVFGCAPLVVSTAARLRLAAANRRHRKAVDHETNLLLATIKHLKEYKAQGYEGPAEQLLTEAFRAHDQTARRSALTGNAVRGVNRMLERVGELGVLAVAGVLVVRGVVSLGFLLAFVELAEYIRMPFTAGAQSIRSLASGWPSVQRVNELADMAPESSLPSAAPPPSASWQKIVLQGVRYHWGAQTGAASAVIAVPDMQLQRGEHLGLTGANGSGKSTLARLLLRLLTPSAGRIALDDIDIQSIAPSAWRELFATVPQEPMFLPGSVRVNLDPEGAETDEALWTTLKTVGLASSLRNRTGLATDVTGFSRGERQRLALARLILGAHAQIAVLDEPLAAIDAQGRAELIPVLEGWLASRTAVVIGHRAADLAMADRQVVLGGSTASLDLPSRDKEGTS